MARVPIYNRNHPKLNCGYLTNDQLYCGAALLHFSNTTIKQQQMSVHFGHLMSVVNHHSTANLTVVAPCTTNF